MKWESISLGDVLNIKHGYAFKGEHFANAGEYVLLSPGNCLEAGGLRLRDDKTKYYAGEIPLEYLLHNEPHRLSWRPVGLSQTDVVCS